MKILERHLNLAKAQRYWSSHSCLIAQAAKDVYGTKFRYVALHDINLSSGETIPLSKDAQELLLYFDRIKQPSNMPADERESHYWLLSQLLPADV